MHYDVTTARKLAEARHELDWDEQFRLSLYGDHARKIHERDGETDTCSMCGDLCAVKMVNELFGIDKKCKEKGKRSIQKRKSRKIYLFYLSLKTESTFL